MKGTCAPPSTISAPRARRAGRSAAVRLSSRWAASSSGPARCSGSANWCGGWAARASCSSPIPAWSTPATRSGPSSRCATRGLDVFAFDGVEENPTEREVEAGVGVRPKARAIDCIVAVGGGSSMDCAKGINFLLTNGGRMADYKGFGKATQADAAVDRRADHGRHRQRGAVLRADRRREDAHEDGLRRQQGRVPRRHPRSRGDGVAAAGP